MITCYLRYTIDMYKRKEFLEYAKMWIPLVDKYGGAHHGYFLPKESSSDLAVAMFTFPSLAAYEEYRKNARQDPECQKASAYAEETRCILGFERQFLEPVFGDAE